MKVKFDISIREKLVVNFALLCITSILILGFYIYNSSYNAILSRTTNQLTSIREFKKRQIESFFDDRIRDMQLLQKSFGAVDGFDEFEHVNHQLLSVLLKSNYYSFVSFYSENQKCVYILKNDTSKMFQWNKRCDSISFFAEQLKQVVDSRVTITDFATFDGEKVLLVSLPFNNKQGAKMGILSLAVSSKAVNSLVYVNTSLSGMGYSGESYIVGDDFVMRSMSRFDSNSVMLKKVQTQSAQHVFHDDKGVLVANDYRNIEVLSSFTRLKIPDLSWALLVEIDFKELIEPIVQIKNDILVITSVISIIVLILAFVISFKITDPLVNLSKAALEIANGKYGNTLAIKSSDEIGELTDSFNTMSVRIKEQTKELLEREKRLDRFYEATKDGIIIHDSTQPLLINKGLAVLTQYSIEELHDMTIETIIEIKGYEKDFFNIDKPLQFETICFRKDGSFFHAEVNKNSILLEGRRVNSTVIHDITERIAAQVELNKERKKQLSSFIDGQENERKRVSRELHDGLGQALIAIKMRLESIDADDKTEKTNDSIELTKQFVSNTIDDVRRMSNNLMPSCLVEFGFITAIQNLVDQLTITGKFDISFDYRAVPKNIDEKIQLYMYRIVQEAVNNAIKHSEATVLQIFLMCEEKNLVLIIEDNGKGFQSNQTQVVKGNGLYHMKERVELLQGTISFTSNKGLTIHIKIPIKQS